MMDTMVGTPDPEPAFDFDQAAAQYREKYQAEFARLAVALPAAGSFFR